MATRRKTACAEVTRAPVTRSNEVGKAASEILCGQFDAALLLRRRVKQQPAADEQPGGDDRPIEKEHEDCHCACRDEPRLYERSRVW